MDLLSGETITFLFTDLEGSTRLWEQSPDGMNVALKRHDAILRATIEASGGHVVKTTGDGMNATFTEGFATVDLVGARALLAAVALAGPPA